MSVFLVADVEATCGPPGQQLDRRVREVIELGLVAVDGESGEILGEWASLVRPVLCPKLSDFCTQLTGIRQEDVDRAPVFSVMWEQLQAWSGLPDSRTATFCAWGSFDQRILARECRRSGVPWLLGQHHLDLRKAFSRVRKRRWESLGLRAASRIVGVEPLAAHRALPDAHTAALLLPWCVVGRRFSVCG